MQYMCADATPPPPNLPRSSKELRSAPREQDDECIACRQQGKAEEGRRKERDVFIPYVSNSVLKLL